MRRFKCISVVLSLAILLSALFSTPSIAQAATQTSNSSIVLNSVTLDNIGKISEFHFNGSTLNFIFNSKKFSFNVNKINITNTSATINGAQTFSGESRGLACNLLSYNGFYSILVINKNESPFLRQTDVDTNFTVAYGKNVATSLGNVKNNSTIQSYLQTNTQALSNDTKSVTNGLLSSGKTLHVLASGASIPLVLSSGVAEGWCDRTTLVEYSPDYIVTNMRYSVAYNWPSDGISLWYDYKNSDAAYESPAWPAAGLTYVSGSWEVNPSIAKFVAEATVSLVVKGVPIMYPVYDTSDIY